MTKLSEHTHHIRIQSSQLEIPSQPQLNRQEDYEDKLKAAELELQRIQEQRKDLERKKQALQELDSKKHQFITLQSELQERLQSSVTLLDRELVELRQHNEDLEQCRTCFALHLDKIQRITPEQWTSENLNEKMQHASAITDLALDEYNQASDYFKSSHSARVFGFTKKTNMKTSSITETNVFWSHFKNGLAFNLPILILGIIALLYCMIQ